MFDATCSHLDAIIVSSRRLHTLLFNLSRTPSSYRREPRPDSLHDLLSSVCCRALCIPRRDGFRPKESFRFDNLRDGRRDHCLPRRVNDGLGIGRQRPVCGEQFRVFGGTAAFDFDQGVHKFPTGICQVRSWRISE